MKSATARYTIEEIVNQHQALEIHEFLSEVSAYITDLYGNKFNWKNFRFLPNHKLMVCKRDGVPVGFMLARLFNSAFDSNVRIFQQDLLYARPGTRAAKLLMDNFIDFGKANANHVISMIGEHTNIKGRSLEKLGFKELETLYRLEV